MTLQPSHSASAPTKKQASTRGPYTPLASLKGYVSSLPLDSRFVQYPRPPPTRKSKEYRVKNPISIQGPLASPRRSPTVQHIPTSARQRPALSPSVTQRTPADTPRTCQRPPYVEPDITTRDTSAVTSTPPHLLTPLHHLTQPVHPTLQGSHHPSRIIGRSSETPQGKASLQCATVQPQLPSSSAVPTKSPQSYATGFIEVRSIGIVLHLTVQPVYGWWPPQAYGPDITGAGKAVPRGEGTRAPPASGVQLLSPITG
ncbi:hypothetical protein BDK51DRAFT_42066 [Blyttiomyces helicus]|uniref:Uncharacterized protein n=1 Tax=Blyttiomyces helicus TaxID=388810 RepID=A0A4P9WRS5_9FUNG|nr:hypothetical protein BDK51DRAFT_42066 [Blyttiomyces helicus]|eukprot:RKO94608.1 hypothetical protein BDK51DRAFT_42066 [Blyttiomyces helicus]